MGRTWGCNCVGGPSLSFSFGFGVISKKTSTPVSISRSCAKYTVTPSHFSLCSKMVCHNDQSNQIVGFTVVYSYSLPYPQPLRMHSVPLHRSSCRWSSQRSRCRARQQLPAVPLHQPPCRWSSRRSRCRARQQLPAVPLQGKGINAVLSMGLLYIT